MNDLRILPNACPDCGADMELRKTSKFLTRGGEAKLFYGCTRFPYCRATHGAHPDGRPLGIPADRATKAARQRAHRAFDRFWIDNKRMPRKKARNAAYRRLQFAMGLDSYPHIAELNAEQCEVVVRLCASWLPLERRYDAWEYLVTEVAA